MCIVFDLNTMYIWFSSPKSESLNGSWRKKNFFLLLLPFYEINLIRLACNWHLFKQIANRNNKKISHESLNMCWFFKYPLFEWIYATFNYKLFFIFSGFPKCTSCKWMKNLINLNMMHCIANVNLNAPNFRNAFCFADVFFSLFVGSDDKILSRKKTHYNCTSLTTFMSLSGLVSRHRGLLSPLGNIKMGNHSFICHHRHPTLTGSNYPIKW